MSRINTNVSSMLAQRVLSQQNQSLQTSLERLSTGLRINRGRDDPAGLIASENLRAEKAALTAAIGNGERADQVLNIAEGGLNEVNALLVQLESLVDSSANDAGLSAQEKEANQIQIDSILNTIDRLATAVNFQGEKLLDGTQAFKVGESNGVESAEVTKVQVNAAKIATGSALTVNATVNTAATRATAGINLGQLAGEVLTQGTTIEITGSKGTQQLSFGANADISAIQSAINDYSDVTGVQAAAPTDSGGAGTDDTLELQSTAFGSDQSISVKVISGDAIVGAASDDGAANVAVGQPVTDSGTDVDATINGQAANGDGLTARVANSALDIEVTFDSSFAATSTFSVDGGGAKFQLSPDLGFVGMEAIGLQSVSTGTLGSAADTLNELRSGGSLSVTDASADLSLAQDAVRGAIKTVSQTRGRIGAFQSQTVRASIRSNQVALENTASAESQIRDTDFASETAELTRSQILVNAATNVLSLANSQPQSVLSLLG